MIVTKILNTYKFNKIDSGSIQKRRTLGRKKLLKDTKQDLNTLKFTSCSQKDNIKMLILKILIYKFNVVPVRIPTEFLLELARMIMERMTMNS